MSDEPLTPIAKPRRLWIQFSLRTLLLVVTIFCVWIGVRVDRVHRQRRAVEFVRSLGGWVMYDYESNWISERLRNRLLASSEPQLPGPQWLRNWLGIDYLARVSRVQLLRENQLNDETLKVIADLPDLTILELTGKCQVTKAGLAHLERLTHLRRLYLWGAQVNRADTAELSQALPNCKIHLLPSISVGE